MMRGVPEIYIYTRNLGQLQLLSHREVEMITKRPTEPRSLSPSWRHAMFTLEQSSLNLWWSNRRSRC